ncbi:hypothetical protein BDE27_3340 [Xenorhabdus ehlersii]|uniref:Uncharacterized protein n=1 Tax=Xenorhabdus ehlersii TaxID=290111 RepID=A0A2D0IL09_9GAMM|nr:hypothetical protein [Xenorhabdus sp. TS4]PHM22476.1 hypothetical protein Xehl_03624 [Xenorhabdus ehlersii]RKE88691.1 hypothetical protein BDE27_3340 [Xenorhabdus ehlersii]
MKKYLVGALCALYFLLVPVQATALRLFVVLSKQMQSILLV